MISCSEDLFFYNTRHKFPFVGPGAMVKERVFSFPGVEAAGKGCLLLNMAGDTLAMLDELRETQGPTYKGLTYSRSHGYWRMTPQLLHNNGKDCDQTTPAYYAVNRHFWGQTPADMESGVTINTVAAMRSIPYTPIFGAQDLDTELLQVPGNNSLKARKAMEFRTTNQSWENTLLEKVENGEPLTGKIFPEGYDFYDVDLIGNCPISDTEPDSSKGLSTELKSPVVLLALLQMFNPAIQKLTLRLAETGVPGIERGLTDLGSINTLSTELRGNRVKAVNTTIRTNKLIRI